MTGSGIEYSPCIKCDKTKCSFCKLTNLAREIFEEIEEVFNKRIVFYTDMKKQPTLFFVEQYAEAMITNCNIYLQEIAELKKKYTEDGK